MSQYLNLIRSAMESRRSISCQYDGFFREMTPYILGWKKNELHCLFYQYGGKSKSSIIDGVSNKNWRCIKLSKLRNVVILDEPLHAPNKITHKKKSTCVDRVILEIKL